MLGRSTTATRWRRLRWPLRPLPPDRRAGARRPAPHTAGNPLCPRGPLSFLAKALADDGQVAGVSRLGAIAQHLVAEALVKPDQERQSCPDFAPQFGHPALARPLFHPAHQQAADPVAPPFS